VLAEHGLEILKIMILCSDKISFPECLCPLALVIPGDDIFEFVLV